MKTSRFVALLATVGVLGAAQACGSLTAGGFTGEATVVVSGDADTLAAVAPVPAWGRPSRASGPARSSEGAEGHIEVQFDAYLVAEDGATVRLGDEIEASVDLRGEQEADVVRMVVPAVRYLESRLVFKEVHVEVQGLVIDGVPVTEVNVELDDINLTIARMIDLDLEADGTVEILIDLNTLAWLDAVDPETGTVHESVFADLVNVVVR